MNGVSTENVNRRAKKKIIANILIHNNNISKYSMNNKLTTEANEFNIRFNWYLEDNWPTSRNEN